MDLGNGLATYITSLRKDTFIVYDVAANQLYEFNSLKMADGTSTAQSTYGAGYTVTDATGTSIFFSEIHPRNFKTRSFISNLNDLNQPILFNLAGTMD